MADLARIGFVAETSDLKDAKASLEALVPAAQRAEKAARGVTAAAAGLAGGIKPFSNAVQQAATGAGTLNRSALMAGTAMGTVQRAAVGAGAALDTLGGRVTRVGMNFAQADAHVEAYKRSLVGIAPAANSAKSAIDRMGASANDNINAMQSTPGNIAAQFQDIGVTSAAGMSPMLIALQQGTQLSAAMTGGLGNLVKGLKQVFSPVSLLTIGIVGLVAVGIQWAMTALSASDASETLSDKLDKVKFSTNAVGDAQGILGGVMDIATGKINTQSGALIALARAQLLVARVQSQARAAEARSAINEAAVRNIAMAPTQPGFQSGMAGGGAVPSEFRRSAGGDIARQFELGLVTADKAIQRLETLRAAGRVTDEAFAGLASSIANYGVEMANQKVFEDAQRLLDGDTTGTGYLLDPKKDTSRSSRGKTEAQKFEDIVTGATADIATQKTRELNAAYRDNAEAVATAEQRTKLLNDAQGKGIALTPQMRLRIDELAAAYGRAVGAADQAEAIFDISSDVDDQMRALAQAKKEIGLYGEALTTLRYEHELLNAAEDAGVKIVGDLTDAERAYVQTLRDRAAVLSRIASGTDRKAFAEGQRKDHEDTIAALARERGEIGLTGEALEAYRIETDMLNQARREGLALTEPELAALGRYAREQAAAEEAIRRTVEALAEARETARGFFRDWYDGIMSGKNIFASFADAVMDGLSRIASKMMDRAIDKFLDMMFAGNSGSTGGGGLLDSVFNAVFGSGSVKKFALGGVVDRPTMFAHAAGLGQAGEAGPEGILPLKRGPDGSLGVQSHGAGGTVVNAPVEVSNTYHVSGAVTPNDIVRMIRAGSEQTQKEVKRQLTGWLQQIQVDGGTV